MEETGLVLGAGTCLARMESGGRLSLDADRDRLLTLLSVAKKWSMTADILAPVEAAAGYWRQGDKALANLRLVFAGLPRLDDPAEADRLQHAADVLDGGMAPRFLMKAVGLDAAGFDLEKYDPNQPRVPAGRGRASGQWGDGTDRGTSAAPSPTVQEPEQSRLPIVPVAADGPLTPGGMGVGLVPGTNPLDPKGLNGELNPAEQKSVIDTINTIIEAKPEDA